MMDSIEALEKVNDSISRGASALDFSPSDITGDCAAQVQEIVRLRKSGIVTEDSLNKALLCLNDGNGLIYLGLIAAGFGHWNCSIKAYEKAQSIFTKLGDVQGAAQTYGNLGLVYADMGEWSKAIEFYQKSLVTFEKLGDVHGAAQTYGNLGSVYYRMGEWNKAIEFYQKDLKISEKLGDVHGAAQTYGNLGLVYADMGEWSKAIEFYQKILETFEKHGDVQGAAQTYGNLGLVYADMGEWNKAIEFYQKDLKISEKLGDVHGAAQTYGNLGLVYHRMGEWSKAIEYYQKSLETKEKLGDVQGAAQTYNNLGLVYARKGEWNKAIEFYQKSLETSEKLGDVQGAAQTYGNLGSMYARKGEWNKAIEFYQKILETFEKLGDVHNVAKSYGNLGLVYADMGEWNKAIEFYQKDLEISEKLGDVHGKGITLSNLGKLHLDKEQPEPEKARKYLEEGIKLLNKEARPEYPNALNWIASCYHKLGSTKKAQAKREKDYTKREELVNSAAALFSIASEHYSEVAGLPRVNILSLRMYTHLDKGLSYSVNNIAERDEQKALKLLDNAIKEFKEALKFADEKDRLRLKGIISEHEAKRYIRHAAVEISIKSQNKMLDKAVEALQNAVGYFEKLGDEKQCDIKTCDGCRHLFKGLRSFRMGIKENSKKLIGEAVSELHEARLCYDGALNELGKDTVDILNKSFDYVDKLIESEDKELTTKVTREFIKIIDELSSTGLQKIVKMYTFDESMNVKGQGEKLGYTPETLTDKLYKITNKLANPATIAALTIPVATVVLLIYGYDQYAAAGGSVVIGIFVFIFLAILNLKKQ